MCVMGLVTFIERRPATQRRKPKRPVTRQPHRKTLPCHVEEFASVRRTLGSPVRMTKGKSSIAEPAFVHQASSMVELWQYGREDLMRTAWRAIISEESTP